jgi:hypothetical protein
MPIFILLLIDIIMSKSIKNTNLSIQKEIEQLVSERRIVEERLSKATQEGAKLFLQHLLNHCEEKLSQLYEAEEVKAAAIITVNAESKLKELKEAHTNAVMLANKLLKRS